MSQATPPAGSWRRAARPVALVLLTLGVAGGVLLTVARLGDVALHRIGPRERYRVRFADIVSDTPPRTPLPIFLSEVRYVSGFPETFNALEPADRDQLAKAFAAHPWVESVDEVVNEPANVVRVRLKFRTPVIKVTTADGSTRLVDGSGILLPVTESPSGVAELVGLVPPPSTPAGHVWADESVKRAVEVVRAYKPTRLERIPTGWRLTLPDGRVLLVDR